jgi:cytochrome d ubiquinol oxidase subunit I
MRVMAYLATLIALFALWGGWVLYRRRLEHAKWFLRLAPWAIITPFLMNTAGWLLTENGRQPWIVQGLMKTANGVSPSVSATDIWISIIVFLLVFIALGVADAWLMLRYGRRLLGQDPLAKVTEETAGAGSTDRGPSEEDEPSLVY